MEKKFDFNVVRRLRKARKLTLEKLAKKAHIAYATLAKLEVNKVNPTVETLEKIAHTLGIAAGNLLTLAERFSAEKKEPEDFSRDGAACLRINYDDVSLTLVTAPKGHVVSKHMVHEQDYEVCFVIEGSLRVKVHDKEYELNAGEALRYDGVFEHMQEALENSRYMVVRLAKDKVR